MLVHLTGSQTFSAIDLRELSLSSNFRWLSPGVSRTTKSTSDSFVTSFRLLILWLVRDLLIREHWQGSTWAHHTVGILVSVVAKLLVPMYSPNYLSESGHSKSLSTTDSQDCTPTNLKAMFLQSTETVLELQKWWPVVLQRVNFDSIPNYHSCLHIFAIVWVLFQGFCLVSV